MSSPSLRLALGAVLVFAAYFLGSLLGLELRFPPATTSLLWPPNALLTAVLLLTPPRRWWVLLLAALPAHLLVQLPHWPLGLVLGLFATNCSEALLAAGFVHALSDAPDRFDSLRRAAVFLLGAVLIAPLVSCFLDAAVVALARGEIYWSVWSTRFYSNTLTELTLVPVIVASVRAWREPAAPRLRGQRIEALLLAGLLLLDGALVFAGPRDALRIFPASSDAALVLLLPLLLWAAVRFGASGSSFALLTTALVAIASHTVGSPSVAEVSGVAQGVLDLQVFLLVCGIPLFGLGSLTEEQHATERELGERLCFEGLLARISGAFVHLPSDRMAEAFQDQLGRVGEFFGFDHAVLEARIGTGDRRLELGTWSARRPDPATTTSVWSRSVPLEAGSATIGELRFLSSQPAEPSGTDSTSRLLLIADVFASALARKESEDALRANEAMKSAILASVPNAVAVLDRGGRIIGVNASWTRSVGYTPSEDGGVGLDFLETWRRLAAGDPEAADAAKQIEAVLRGTRPTFSLEYRHSPLPEERWFAMSVAPLLRPEGGAVVSHLDVTERRRAENDARKSRDELAHYLRVSTVGELTTSIAHELNQPLTAILANAQAAQLMLKAEPEPAELREILSDIADEGKRAGEVIRRLRELLRKGEPEHAPVELNELVREVSALLGGDAAIRGVAVTFELGAPPFVVNGDRVQLQQVALNLLLNAMDAMADCPPGERSIVVRTACVGTDVHLSVQDAGIGLRDDTEARAFEPFYSTKSSGMGMGLSIARSIVEAHGGTIWCQNNHERGATFTLALPLADDLMPAAREDAAAVDKRPPPP